MRTHTIHWEHLDVDGRTCDRCSDTGELLRTLVKELNTACRSRGVRLELQETALPPDRLEDSNRIRIDGRPLTQGLPGTASGLSECSSCGTLIGEPAACRTVEHGGNSYAVPPLWLIRQAVCRAAGCC